MSQKTSKVEHRLFTVATLTGHVIHSYGAYPACLDNGPASAEEPKSMCRRLSEVGENYGEPWEISTLGCEDYKMFKATSVKMLFSATLLHQQ